MLHFECPEYVLEPLQKNQHWCASGARGTRVHAELRSRHRLHTRLALLCSDLLNCYCQCCLPWSALQQVCLTLRQAVAEHRKADQPALALKQKSSAQVLRHPFTLSSPGVKEAQSMQSRFERSTTTSICCEGFWMSS